MTLKNSLLAALTLTMASCSTTPNNESGIKYGEDFIVFEAEATLNAIPENWIIRREGNSGYNDIEGEKPANAATYIEYVGGVSSGLDIPSGRDVLQYKFTPTHSGAYRLTGRMAQQLNQHEGTAPWDQCNDIFIKMEGNFTSGDEQTPIETLREWTKFYGRGLNKWGSFMYGDANHAKYKMVYQLTAGEEYTFSISGRSKGVAIDYILLTSLPLEIEEKDDIAIIAPPQMTPDPINSGRYSSISFDKFTGWDSGFVDATIDPWRKVLQIAERLEWGAAETSFKGEEGSYKITLNTMLESDGESSFKVYIDSMLIGEVTNERVFGTEIKDYTPAAIVIGENVEVAKDATIRVEFSSATNGLVPEGDLTATSRGRWQSITFE